MQPRRDRKNDVAAIELASGQEVERSCKHSYPRRRGDRMHQERRGGDADMQQARRHVEHQRESELNL